MEKPQLLMFLVAYLIIITTICSFVYTAEAWTPSGFSSFTEDAENFENVNISELNMEDMKGGWEVEDGKLISKSKNSEFWLYKDDLTLGVGGHTYNEFNITTLPEGEVSLYVGKCTYLNRGWKSYWALNRTYDKIIFKVDVANTIWGWLREDTYIVWVYSYTFGDEPYYLVNTSTHYTGEGTDSLVVLYSDINIITPNTTYTHSISALPEMRGFLWLEGGHIAEAGLKSADSGITLDYVQYVKKQTTTTSIADILPLLVEILLFNPPELNIPTWLHFLLFYLPLIGVIVIGAEMIRGN